MLIHFLNLNVTGSLNTSLPPECVNAISPTMDGYASCNVTLYEASAKDSALFLILVILISEV